MVSCDSMKDSTCHVKKEQVVVSCDSIKHQVVSGDSMKEHMMMSWDSMCGSHQYEAQKTWCVI